MCRFQCDLSFESWSDVVCSDRRTRWLRRGRCPLDLGRPEGFPKSQPGGDSGSEEQPCPESPESGLSEVLATCSAWTKSRLLPVLYSAQAKAGSDICFS